MEELIIDKKGYVGFNAITEYNGELYIADRNNRGLLEYDLKSKETTVKNVFMAENFMNNYWISFVYGEEIWFVPLRDYQKIAIYNVVNNMIEFLAFPKSNHKCPYIPFMDYVIVGEYVYLSPAHYDSELKINLKTREITRIDIGVEEYTGDGYPIINASKMVGNYLVLCPFNNDELILIDVNTDKVERKIKLPKVKAYTNIAIYNDDLYLTPIKIEYGLCKVDMEKNQTEDKDISIKDEFIGLEFEGSIYDNSKVYFFPKNSSVIIIYDFQTNNCKYVYTKKDGDLRTVSFNRSRQLTEKMYVVISENTHSPCILYHEGSIEVLDIKLPEDYFLQELLMELKERESYDIGNRYNI